MSELVADIYRKYTGDITEVEHLEAAPSLYVALLGVAALQVVQLKSKPGGAFQFEFSLQTY